MADLQPGQTLGKYRLERLLGRGGMGVVWQAWQGDLNRNVALKFVQLAEADDLKRFEREARMAAGLNHPNIAQVYEIGDVDGRRYIAMQFVAGRTLADVKDAPARRVAELLRDAALGLDAAHRQGVVHRDVKPQNIMLDEAGRVFVMDFGLARSVAADSSLTASGMMVGTPSYMSPEQAQGRGDIDARADIYALGATLYELLTGRRAFDGDNVMSIVMRVVGEDPAAPRRIRPGIPADLQTICLKAMEKERERRYGSAREFADDLRRFLDGEPIHATPPTLMTVLVKSFRRNRGVFIAGAVAVLVAGLAAGVAIGGAFSRRREVARLVMLGDDAFAKRDWGHAKACYDQALGLSPGHATASARAADCSRELDAITADRARLQAREEARRSAIEPFEAGRKAFDDAILLFYRQGATFLEIMEELSRAADRFTESIARFPETPEVWVYRGRARMLMRDQEKAAVDFDRAVALDGGLSIARYWRGMNGVQILDDLVGQGTAWGGAQAMDARASELHRSLLDDFRHSATKLGEPGKERMAAAFAELLEGRFDLALSGATELVRSHPRLEETHILRARALYAVERTAEAVVELEEALRLQPNNLEALLQRASLLYQLDRHAECESAYEAFIRFGGPYPEAVMTLGLARMKLGRVKEGFAEIERIYGQIPDRPERFVFRALALSHLGRVEDALKEIEPFITHDRLNGLYNRSKILIAAGRHDAALPDLDEVVRATPGNPNVRYHRGLCRYHARRFAEAVEDFTVTLRSLPSMADALKTRGLAFWELDRRDEALADMDAAIASAPDDIDARLNRATCRIQLGRFEAAIDDLDVAIRRAPKDAELHGQRGRALAELRRDTEALAALDLAASLGPEEADWPYWTGRVRERQGDWNAAAAGYERAAELAPDRENPWARLGIARMKTGRREAAVAAFDRAIALNDRNASALGNRGILHGQLGHWRQSLDDLSRAIELDPALEGALKKWRDQAREKLKE